MLATNVMHYHKCILPFCAAASGKLNGEDNSGRFYLLTHQGRIYLEYWSCHSTFFFLWFSVNFHPHYISQLSQQKNLLSHATWNTMSKIYIEIQVPLIRTLGKQIKSTTCIISSVAKGSAFCFHYSFCFMHPYVNSEQNFNISVQH